MNNTQPKFLSVRLCVSRIAIVLGAGVLLPALLSNAHAKIYTCVDAQGRKITSDRPIAACIDREQKQLGSNGIVKRIIKPSYTLAEIKEQERLQRQAQAKAAQERARAKTLTALLQRYPTPESLKKARLAEVTEAEKHIRDGYTRLKQTKKQQETLNKEFAFYAKNPEKAPRPLRIKKKSLENTVKKHKEYIAKQHEVLAEIHKKFDRTRDTLKPLWQQ